MRSDCFECALRELGESSPFGSPQAYYALVEIEATDPAHDRARLETTLCEAIEAGRALDAVLAASLDEAARRRSTKSCTGACAAAARFPPNTASVD
ncbi:MAG: FAD-linked oxidase C-terminal domain-containing protein [Pseudomonadota bacterium]|jgi:hypothetical protein